MTKCWLEPCVGLNFYLKPTLQVRILLLLASSRYWAFSCKNILDISPRLTKFCWAHVPRQFLVSNHMVNKCCNLFVDPKCLKSGDTLTIYKTASLPKYIFTDQANQLVCVIINKILGLYIMWY